MENSNNTIKISGVVASLPVLNHETFGEKFYYTTMETTRTSSNTDEVPVIFSERLVNPEDIQVGDHLSLDGQVRTFNKKIETAAGEKSRLVITVFARELTKLDEEQYRDTNEVNLIGYVCKEPVYRKTPLGREICDILVAINRPYGKSDYVPCISWGRNARYASDFEVGKQIELRGRFQSRKYFKKIDVDHTEERTAYEVSVSRIHEIED